MFPQNQKQNTNQEGQNNSIFKDGIISNKVQPLSNNNLFQNFNKSPQPNGPFQQNNPILPNQSIFTNQQNTSFFNQQGMFGKSNVDSQMSTQLFNNQQMSNQLGNGANQLGNGANQLGNGANQGPTNPFHILKAGMQIN